MKKTSTFYYFWTSWSFDCWLFRDVRCHRVIITWNVKH